jgi:hypothetical protein
VIYALGKDNPDATITSTNALLNGKSYKNVMQGVMNWLAFGQDPDGGWRYGPNQNPSDNSTAQWGALPFLYGESWGLTTPASVTVGDATTLGLDNWTAAIQHPQDGTWRAGGSGYDGGSTYVNMAKTGGLLLELAVLDRPVGDASVQNALNYMDSMVGFDHWNQGALYSGDQWYGGNMNNPYAMWAVYKGLEVYGLTSMDPGPDGILGWNPGPDGILGTADDYCDDYQIGSGISTAPGGIVIGQDWDPDVSLAGDWYSQYCDNLVNWQNANGSWNGYAYWTGAMATGWYINILNATGAPEPVVPVPAAVLLGILGLSVAGWRLRREA